MAKDLLLRLLEQEAPSEIIPEEEPETEQDVKSKAVLSALVKRVGRKLLKYRPGLEITISYKDQLEYTYKLVKKVGVWTGYPMFKPELTPSEILSLGVWGGKKFNDSFREYPREWFLSALVANKLSVLRPLKNINEFKVFEYPGLEDWRDTDEDAPKDPEDPRGWLQWYMRFYLGRRIPNIDRRQINRWVAFNKRFKQMIESSCKEKDIKCKPKIKQAMLSWAIDSRKL